METQIDKNTIDGFISLYQTDYKERYLIRSQELDNTGSSTVGKTSCLDEYCYKRHLYGNQEIGINPLFNGNCKFAIIDIDKDNINHSSMARLLYKKSIPAVVVRSRGKRMHLHFFFSKKRSLKLVLPILKKLANELGFNEAEFFPSGNSYKAITLPYSPIKEAAGFDYEGNELSLEEFVKFANDKVIAACDKWLKQANDTEKKSLNGAPPCISCYVDDGEQIPVGFRNGTFFQIAIFYRKKGINQEKCYENLSRINYSIAANETPLKDGEIKSIIKSSYGDGDEKEYNYSCNINQIIEQKCNRAICEKLKYGVTSSTMKTDSELIPPDIHWQLEKIMCEPPIYNLILGDKTILFKSSRELLSLAVAREKIFDATKYILIQIKEITWLKTMQHLIKKATEIEAPIDASDSFAIEEAILEFCHQKARTMLSNLDEQENQDLLKINGAAMTNEGFLFKGLQLYEYLKIVKNIDTHPNLLWNFIRKMGGSSSRHTLKNSRSRAWCFGTNTNVYLSIKESQNDSNKVIADIDKKQKLLLEQKTKLDSDDDNMM